MTAAFKTQLTSTKKFVFIAICDNANDQGECFPSIPMLMQKCSLSERAIQSAISSLEADGYLRRELRNGRSTIYWITDTNLWPSAPAPRAPHPRRRCTPAGDAPRRRCGGAGDAPPPRRRCGGNPAGDAPRTINRTVKEPSEDQHRRRASSPDRRHHPRLPNLAGSHPQTPRPTRPQTPPPHQGRPRPVPGPGRPRRRTRLATLTPPHRPEPARHRLQRPRPAAAGRRTPRTVP